MKSVNIIIPMAGLGSRFRSAGYAKPKPFIDVKGRPMIEWVMENMGVENANYILIGMNEHLKAEKETVQRIQDKYRAEFVGIDELTQGTACTVLHAVSHINNEIPLIIANSDQYIENFSVKNFIQDSLDRHLDGSILTFKDGSLNPKWSFAKLNSHGLVDEVKEKVPISDIATVGIYLFNQGKTFVEGAVQMILNDDRVNNEFYTCPVYNYSIREGKRIGIFNIDFHAMNGLGTPEDLNIFLEKF